MATRGAVGYAMGGRRGILNDLVEFLEERVDGFESDSSPEWDDLLQQGSLAEVKEELAAAVLPGGAAARPPFRPAGARCPPASDIPKV